MNQGYLKNTAVECTAKYLAENGPECRPLMTICGELSIMRSTIINLAEAVEILERATTNRILSDISGPDVEPHTVAEELSIQSARVQEMTTRLTMIVDMLSRQLNGKKLE